MENGNESVINDAIRLLDEEKFWAWYIELENICGGKKRALTAITDEKSKALLRVVE